VNVDLIAVDRVREPYVRSGCSLYLARLRDVMPVDVIEVRRSAQSDGVVIEGERILERVPQGALLWALDERGQQLTSTSLAARINKVQQSGKRRLCFAIGGDRGISDGVRTRAELLWSLSPLTFLHEMARLIVLEQLYRAAKINRGEPYHRS
jgi:23S rRNA (pseudouridine1915-N3)-methyltransferase